MKCSWGSTCRYFMVSLRRPSGSSVTSSNASPPLKKTSFLKQVKQKLFPPFGKNIKKMGYHLLEEQKEPLNDTSLHNYILPEDKNPRKPPVFSNKNLKEIIDNIQDDKLLERNLNPEKYKKAIRKLYQFCRKDSKKKYFLHAQTSFGRLIEFIQQNKTELGYEEVFIPNFAKTLEDNLSFSSLFGVCENPPPETHFFRNYIQYLTEDCLDQEPEPLSKKSGKDYGLIKNYGLFKRMGRSTQAIFMQFNAKLIGLDHCFAQARTGDHLYKAELEKMANQLQRHLDEEDRKRNTLNGPKKTKGEGFLSSTAQKISEKYNTFSEKMNQRLPEAVRKKRAAKKALLINKEKLDNIEDIKEGKTIEFQNRAEKLTKKPLSILFDYFVHLRKPEVLTLDIKPHPTEPDHFLLHYKSMRSRITQFTTNLYHKSEYLPSLTRTGMGFIKKAFLFMPISLNANIKFGKERTHEKGITFVLNKAEMEAFIQKRKEGEDKLAGFLLELYNQKKFIDKIEPIKKDTYETVISIAPCFIFSPALSKLSDEVKLGPAIQANLVKAEVGVKLDNIYSPTSQVANTTSPKKHRAVEGWAKASLAPGIELTPFFLKIGELEVKNADEGATLLSFLHTVSHPLKWEPFDEMSKELSFRKNFSSKNPSP